MTVTSKYHCFIPDPYLRSDTLKKLRDMSYAGVRKNLEFHHAKDSSISLKGTLDELAKRLKRLIKTRCVDMRRYRMAWSLIY